MERAMHVHNLFEEVGIEGDRVRMHKPNIKIPLPLSRLDSGWSFIKPAQ